MDQHEFEQFVLENGKNILRFCRLTCQETESGDDAQAAGQTTAIGQPAKCTKLRAVHIHLTMEKQKEKICKPEPAYTNGKHGCHGA